MPVEPRRAVTRHHTSEPGLAPDAAIVLGIASTAMPFAGSLEGEAERWLRLLRLYGEAGAVLQALGVSEVAFPEDDAGAAPPNQDLDSGRDTVGWVTMRAVQIAQERRGQMVGTVDLLQAVMHVYGTDFDHVLRAHGTDRAEVTDSLNARMPNAADR